MNKQLLIVVLAVCLVSTHAFVKRDVPTAADVQAQLDALKNTVDQFANTVMNQTASLIDLEEIKKNIQKSLDEANKVIDNLVKPAGAANAAAQPAQPAA